MRLLRAAATALPRLRGARIGADSYVAPRSMLTNPRRIVLGERTAVGRFVELNPQNGFIHIGNDCSVHNFGVLYGAGGITVHDDCRLATGVVLVAFNHGFDDPTRPIHRQPVTARGIVVESDVWIGARAVVLDGVRIGRGSVVGAGAVVTRDLPPYSVAAGNPARVIRRRIATAEVEVTTS